MMASRSHNLVCPICESADLHSNGTPMTRCDECGCALSKDVLEITQQLAALPDAVEEYACECGHPRCAFCSMVSTGARPAAQRFCPRN